MKAKVAIIGYGWVGKAMYDLFPSAAVYDPAQVGLVIDGDELVDKVVTDDKKVVNQADVAFICVPTPNAEIINGFDDVRTDGELDTSIVEEVISWCECPLIVIRSTVNPGDCDRWSRKYGKTIVMQPEYLGETPQHPLLDTKQTPFLIIGGYPKARERLIDIYTEVYNANVKIRQVTNKQAEIIKLSENRAIAFKVAQCQELYDVCQQADVDYYTIRDAVYGDDPRMNLWFTFVYPDKRGMNSKCIPKDVYAWCAWAESLGYEPEITRALLKKNKEWLRLNEQV